MKVTTKQIQQQRMRIDYWLIEAVNKSMQALGQVIDIFCRASLYATAGRGYQTSKPMADRIAQTTVVTVVSCEDSRQSKKPFPPLITSTLQQSAANVLKK